MKLVSKFNCGDTAYIYSEGKTHAVTIGHIRLTYMQTEGLKESWKFIGEIMCDNMMPIPPTFVEEYMCIETGIGSGNVYKYKENIFDTQEEAAWYGRERTRELEEYRAGVQKRERERFLAQEDYLRSQLKRIEQLKQEEQ